MRHRRKSRRVLCQLPTRMASAPACPASSRASPGGILEEGKDTEVGGIALGAFSEGGLFCLEDLDMAQLDFRWVEEDEGRDILHGVGLKAKKPCAAVVRT